MKDNNKNEAFELLERLTIECANDLLYSEKTDWHSVMEYRFVDIKRVVPIDPEANNTFRKILHFNACGTTECTDCSYEFNKDMRILRGECAVSLVDKKSIDNPAQSIKDVYFYPILRDIVLALYDKFKILNPKENKPDLYVYEFEPKINCYDGYMFEFSLYFCYSVDFLTPFIKNQPCK